MLFYLPLLMVLRNKLLAELKLRLTESCQVEKTTEKSAKMWLISDENIYKEQLESNPKNL